MQKRHLPACLIAISISAVQFYTCFSTSLAREIDDAADLPEQQAQEKLELQDMKNELRDIQSTINEARDQMEDLRQNYGNNKKVNEIHLIAKEIGWEIAPGQSTTLFSYNGQLPGPVIRLKEGELVKIVLHNNLKVPTSLYFHGLLIPHSVNGLPRKEQGLIQPGQTYAYQFIASQPGTFWYHPQINHLGQIKQGLSGAIVVEPTRIPKTYERDFVYVIGQTTINKANAKSSTYFMVNGKSAPAIPPVELKKGEKIRLRLINTSESVCPLHLTGHKFEVISLNGSDALEPHVNRDTVSLNPGDRADLEFIADNPGVWSFHSLLPAQCTNNDQFPGGIAVIMRYQDQ